MEFGAQNVAAVVGFILSFLVESIPGFNEFWSAFSYKRLAVVASGLFVTAAMIGLAYAGAPIAGVPKPFIWDGLWSGIATLVAYIVATQAAYVIQADKLARNQE